MSYNPYSKPLNERDTHFQGFAKLLYEDFFQLQREDESSIKELLAPDYPEKWRKKIEQRIAQRAYDLVKHALDKANTGYMICPENDIADVPDLTEWPERS